MAWVFLPKAPLEALLAPEEVVAPSGLAAVLAMKPPVLEEVLPNPREGTPINAMFIYYIVTVDLE